MIQIKTELEKAVKSYNHVTQEKVSLEGRMEIERRHSQ